MSIYSTFRIFETERQLDRGILTGLGLSFALLFIAIAASGKVLNFLDIPSIIVVFGGTLGATLVNYSVHELSLAWHAFLNTVSTTPTSAIERIRYLVGLSQATRQEGLLLLEKESHLTEDGFLKKALEITADGQPCDDIRRMLETEMITANDRAQRVVQVFQSMGQVAPAMGLIGTLVGLIQMLGSLNQPSSIGPAMAVALVTTLYGAVLANLVFLPVAGKLRNYAAEDNLVKALTIEGILSLGKQENPIVLEQRLQSFLPQAAFQHV